jgi:hypothetical protein
MSHQLIAILLLLLLLLRMGIPRRVLSMQLTSESSQPEIHSGMSQGLTAILLLLMGIPRWVLVLQLTTPTFHVTRRLIPMKLLAPPSFQWEYRRLPLGQ